MLYFKRMLEAADAIGWITVSDGYCVYLSPGWYRFTGGRRGSAEGYGWLDLVHPDDQMATRAGYFKANDAGSQYCLAYRLQTADGDYQAMWGHGLPRTDEQGLFEGYLGTTTPLPSQYASRIDVDTRRTLPDGMHLTGREREILTLVAEGNTNETIAATLSIKLRTVETLLARAAEKLNANNRTHTVVLAIRLSEI